MAFWNSFFSKKQKTTTGTPSLTIRQRLSALRNLPKFFKLVWQTSPSLAVANGVLRLGKSATPVAILYVGKLIIDQVVQISQGKEGYGDNYLWKLVAIEFGLAILSDVLNRGITLTDSLLGDLFANRTSIKIIEHAATLDLDQFENSTFYDKMERARQQTAGRTVLLSQSLTQVQDLITMAFLAAGLMVFNPWLIVLLLLAIIPAFLGEIYFNNQSYALNRRQTPERRELDYIRFLGASDDTAKEVKLFNLSNFIVSRFRELSNRFYHTNRTLIIRRSTWGSLFAMLGSAGYYLAYAFIIFKAIRGVITIGDLTFLAGSFRQLRGLLESILNRFTSVSQGAMYLADFFEFFEIKSRVVPLKKPRLFPKPIQHGFTFEDVGYKYINSEQWANRHLNFTLNVGEKLALVGENGAGKTTLVKLLARLYEPTEGKILLDGYDLREYDINELRMQIGIIFQDYLRYQMTIAQNIGTGNINKKEDRELIKASAYQSLANMFIEKYENGYDQQLGRRFNNGVELSGGQWQKIALARAYMRDAQLMILDEPTAALDARAEYEVFQRFADLTSGRSSVLISHRFSTVRMADRIIVLDKGQIMEIGSHEQLLQQNGKYAELFHLQAKGYR
jgi:ATP-binding cassette subfamily B protein